VVEVNINKAASAGIPIFISENNVVLTPGVGEKGLLSPEFFRSVYQLKSGKYIHQ
jgi:hypothetical protein